MSADGIERSTRRTILYATKGTSGVQVCEFVNSNVTSKTWDTLFFLGMAHFVKCTINYGFIIHQVIAFKLI